MAQVKKPAVREAILAAAFERFAAAGYANTPLARIARDAGVSQANLYVYFRSKIEILFALYDPWFRKRIAAMDRAIAKAPDARARLIILVTTLWRDLPAANRGFSVNLMQAISIEGRTTGYRPDLLQWVEDRIVAILGENLPPARRKRVANPRVAHALMMALDGFTINYRLNPSRRCTAALAEAFADLLLGARRR